MLLFIDCETNGLPDFKLPSTEPHQPHIVQLAMIAAREDGRVMAECSLLVEPTDWEIPDEVAAVHGITTETAREFGVAEAHATQLFLSMQLRAHLVVAHNVTFDMRILRIAQLRGLGMTREEVEERAKPAACTMQMSRALVNVAPTPGMHATGRHVAKPPKLGEAYEHFFGNALEDAHDAMADVRACMAIYFHIRELEAKAA